MPLTVEDAREISNMRLKMVQNMQADLPPQTGIDKEDLKIILDKVRKDRTLGDTTGSKKKAKAPLIPLDLGALMTAAVGEKKE